MNRRLSTLLLPSILALVSSFAAGAHEGEVKIYTGNNDRLAVERLPGHCLVDGLLVCHLYHPVLQDGVMKTGLERRDRSDADLLPHTEKLFPSSQRQPTIKLSADGICLAPGDPGFERTTRFELVFSLEDCRRRGGLRLQP